MRFPESEETDKLAAEILDPYWQPKKKWYHISDDIGIVALMVMLGSVGFIISFNINTFDQDARGVMHTPPQPSNQNYFEDNIIMGEGTSLQRNGSDIYYGPLISGGDPYRLEIKNNKYKLSKLSDCDGHLNYNSTLNAFSCVK